MQIIDKGITAPPNVWGTRVGPDIGGTPPSDYGVTQGTITSHTAANFRTSGERYTDWLGYSSRWIPPGATWCALDFDLWLDPNVAARAQALEFDWKGNINSLMRNLSGQININKGWVWQVFKGDDWADAVTVGLLEPSVKHQVEIWSTFDATTYSPLGIRIDGVAHLVPLSLQDQPGIPITPEEWALMVANVQVQLDANDPGGPFAIQIDNFDVRWQ